MGSPVRILHVVVNMNRGGAETLIMNLYRNIDRAKVQFDFLTCKEGVFDAEIRKMGGTIHRIPYVSDVGHFKYIRELNSFFSKHSYQIVHSHMDKMSGLVLRSAKKAGVPVRISHSHNTKSEGGLAVRMYKWFAGKLIPANATELFACSDFAAEWLFHGRARNTKIVKNGIEAEQFTFSNAIRNDVRKELNIKKDTFVLGHVGRLSPQKNHLFLIDLFEKFYRQYSNSLLLLTGDGPLRNEIENKIRERDLVDKVRLIGIRNDVERILHGFDVFVFPSLHEGLPVSLIEAQGAGLPCLISEEISQEVEIGLNLIHFLPLNNKTLWLRKLGELAENPPPREAHSDTFTKIGFDIKVSANDLEKFYLKASG